MLVGLAHLNHQLRDGRRGRRRPSAPRWPSGWPCRSMSTAVDVRALARAETACRSRSAAHTARHAFLRERGRSLEGGRVALGHTRTTRPRPSCFGCCAGAGARGLAGMHPRNGPFIRPLLDCRRARAARAPGRGRTPVPRRREQRRPQHSAEPGPGRAAAVARARVQPADRRRAWHARRSWRARTERFLEATADALAAVGRLSPSKDAWRVDAGGLSAAPLALAGPSSGSRMERSSGGRPIGLRHVERALRSCAGGDGAARLAGTAGGTHRRRRRLNEQRRRGAGRAAAGAGACSCFAYPAVGSWRGADS